MGAARLLLIFVVAIALTASAATAVSKLQEYYEYLRKSDNTIFAGSVMTQDTSSIITGGSVAFGNRDVAKNLPNWLDTSFRMNFMSEMFVSIAVLELMEQTHLPSLDAAVPPKYLPRGVSFYNPSTPGTALTLRQLLTHTSTLTDSKYAQFQKTSPDTVMSFRSFVEAYFLTSSGGSFSVAADVWYQATPGIDASFKYARANIVLAAFVVEQVLVEKPTLLISPTKTIGAFIQEKILANLGMSSTFVRYLDGSYPKTAYPANTAMFDGKVVTDLTSAGSLLTQTTIHPGYPGDYMYYTSTMDLARLMRSLFLDNNALFKSSGTRMRELPVTIPTSVTTDVLRGQKGQGLGLVFFDGQMMCSIPTAAKVIEKCPLKSTSSVWGHISVGSHSQVGTFCTDTASSINPTCVSVALSFFDSGTNLKSLDSVLGLAAVAFQETIGDQSSGVTASTSTSSRNSLYGVWVFFGVAGTIFFVVLASYATEYVIQPAPVANTVPVPGNLPGLSAQ